MGGHCGRGRLHPGHVAPTPARMWGQDAVQPWLQKNTGARDLGSITLMGRPVGEFEADPVVHHGSDRGLRASGRQNKGENDSPNELESLEVLSEWFVMRYLSLKRIFSINSFV